MKTGSFLALAIAGLLAIFEPATAQQARPLRVSMAKSFVRGQPQVFVDIAAGEFKEVMKSTTGLDGVLIAELSPLETATKLQDKQLEFGILYAHEFAWAQKKYPELQPLLIAAAKKQDKRAHIVVHKDSAAKSIADLRGQAFDLPPTSKEYCQLYLEKICPAPPTEFFGSIKKSASTVDALDEVARRKADATIIDTPWLDFYKEVKGPVFAKNLRVLEQSELVPPAVVVCKQGAVEPATVERVTSGLRKAHEGFRGRALMALWHIDSFEPVPDDYARSLAEVLKAYPPPASWK